MFENTNTDGIKILSVFSAEIHESDVGKREYHYGETNFYQLGIKNRGKTKVRYDRKFFDYCQGSVLYLPQEKAANIPYNKQYIESGDGICVFFSSEYPLIPEARLYSPCGSILYKRFSELERAFLCGKKLEAKSIFFGILASLDETARTKRKSTSLDEVLEYINMNACDPSLDSECLAEKFGFGCDWFRHKFKSDIGVPPKQYILARRMEFAKEYLLCGLDVKTTAERSGFSDSGYFTRYFTKAVGMSPSHFRKAYRRFL